MFEFFTSGNVIEQRGAEELDVLGGKTAMLDV